MSHKSLAELKQSIPNNELHDEDSSEKPKDWIYKKYTEKLKANDPIVLRHLQIAKNKFFKPYFHMFGCTLNVAKSIGLIFVSLPVILLALGILYGINELMAQYMSYSLWQIASDVDSFTSFINDISPAIYWLVYFKVLSFVADRFIQGSQKLIEWTRKLLKLPMTITTIIVTHLIFPIVSAIFVNLYLVTIDKYYVKVIGKLN